MDQYMLIIILMIGAGLLGGITNYFRIEQEEKNSFSLVRNILMGISASLLIPLFLNMISSDLLDENFTNGSKVFIFFGFCLIASLSSKAFIESISDRLLNDLKNTKKELDDMKTNVGPIISRETEPEEAEDTGELLKISFDEDTKKVIYTLGSGKYSWRTVKGLAREMDIPKETVLNSLKFLLSKYLVQTNEKGRWGLTLEGHDIFIRMSSVEIAKRENE